MWRRVVGWIFRQDSKERTAFIFRVNRSNQDDILSSLNLKTKEPGPLERREKFAFMDYLTLNYDPLKRRKLLAQQHGVTPQKTWILSTTAVRTSSLANITKFLIAPFLQNSGHAMY
jgi:hypothetical protein